MGLVRDIADPNRESLESGSAVQANGTAGPFSVGEFRELLLFLNVTVVSGTTPKLNVFIDSSDDGGTTFYQIAQVGSADIATPVQAVKTLCAEQGSAFGDTIQVRWTVSGSFTTGQGFTFTVRTIGK